MWNKGLYLVLLVVGSAVGQNKYNFCVPDDCSKIEPDNAKVTCVPIKDRVECIEKLLNGGADVGFLNSEELLLLKEMNKASQKKFDVVAKSIEIEPTNVDNLFETVAIVNNDHQHGFEGLKDYIYYRSNFGASSYTPRVLEAFERKVVNISNCAPGQTEDEILTKELQKFFKSACRSGSWTPDRKQDEHLKKNITKLCSACGDATNCKDINALEKFIAATDKAVAYATWEETASYFKKNMDKTDKYALLCPDGKTKNLDATMLDKTSVIDCAFITQPQAAVVAVSEKSDNIIRDLKSWWPGGIQAIDAEKEWKNAIYPNIDISKMKIQFEKKSIIEYVPAVEPITSCIAKHTWYVASEEKKKCDLIAGAARVIGVTPEVECEISTGDVETMKKLNSTQGFMKFSSVDGYIARKVYNLAAAKTLNIADTRIVAVITKEAYDKKNNLTLADFSSSHACFPKFGDLSHMAFVSKLRSLNLTKKNECDFGKVVADRFGSVCLPGADTASTLFPYTSSVTTKICNCKKSDGNAICAAESSNKYYNNVLNCLADNNASIAFLNHKDIPKADFEKYYVLCFDGDKKAANLTDIVEEKCTIVYNVINQEILTSSASINMVKNFFDYLSIYLSSTEESTHFIQFEWFAKIFEKPATDFFDSEEKAIANYENMLKDLSSCVPPPETANVTKGSTRSVCSVVTLFLLSLLSRFL